MKRFVLVATLAAATLTAALATQARAQTVSLYGPNGAQSGYALRSPDGGGYTLYGPNSAQSGYALPLH
jgi:hypothetical protein